MVAADLALERERKLLQRVVAVLGLIPVVVAAWGIIWGLPFADQSLVVDVSVASHYRYLSGLLLAVGLLFWSTIPAIETKANRFRILTLAVFIGGLARLVGLALTGVASLPMLGGLLMELIVTPTLCLWQARVARKFRTAPRVEPPAEPEPAVTPVNS